MNISGVNKSNALAIAAFMLAFSGAAFGQTDTGFTYDKRGRLETVTYDNGTTVTYVYDAAGNRTAKVTATPGSSFTQTIQLTGSGPVNLRTLATNAGYVGGQNANITFEVGNGVTIMGDPGGGIALDTGTWPTGFTITLALVVKTGGAIYGGGGNGGAGGADSPTAGDAGGDAIFVQAPINITVQAGGAIGGGGQGGAGGLGAVWYDPISYDQYIGGGGGGGGFPNGLGGAGGVSSDPNFTGFPGNPGSDWSAGGAGGAGQSYNLNFSYSGENGGGAGHWGYAIRKNGNAVSLSGTGTVSGTVN